MVISRSSFSSISRSTLLSDNSLSSYDTDSIITFRPTPAPLNLNLASRTNNGSKLAQPPSLPVTPGTPPASFPHDPFSHPTTLPEPTRSRPGSLAHTLERAGKGPQIVVASPSTSTIHYLFPSAPSSTGVHLVPDDKVGRSGSQRKKHRNHPADAFSAGTRRGKEEGRTTRLASEPTIGLRTSRTFDGEGMRSLRRQPSLADIGDRSRGMVDAPRTLERLVEERKNKSQGLRITPPATEAKTPTLAKLAISSPVLLSPASTSKSRRRSLSLSSPRPAPSIPDSAPTSPQLPSPTFGQAFAIDTSPTVDNQICSDNGEVTFDNPFPASCAMERSPNAWVANPDDVREAVRREVERRLTARPVPLAVIAENPPEYTRERRLSLSGRVRRSLSLKLSADPKSTRRRSQSVTAKGDKVFDRSIPLPLSMSSAATYELGLGDPSVDMDDRYGLAKIIPSRSLGLGLDVRLGLDDLGQRSPQRKRIDLGGSDVSLLASTITTGLGYGSFGSPSSLPESLMEEAVDLTEKGRRVGTPSSDRSGVESYLTSAPTSVEEASLRPRLKSDHAPTPYLGTSSQMASPAFSTPNPQTPFDRTPDMDSSPQIQSGTSTQPSPNPDFTTRYNVTSRKPSLRHSKSFSSAVNQVGRTFSRRTKTVKPTFEPVKQSEPDAPADAAGEKEKHLSRSFSFAMRSRSPMPVEMRPVVEVTLAVEAANVPPPRPPRALKRQASTEIGHRWRPPTMYALCSPDNAVDPLPGHARASTGPRLSVSAPNTPEAGYTERKSSNSTTGAASRSSFLSASTSFRGLTKSLSKSLSRTFERHREPSAESASTDSGLKARISSPLEADTTLLQRISLMSVHDPSPAEIAQDSQKARGGSREWRASIFTQAVSHSIKSGLSEIVDNHRVEVGSLGRSEGATSWSRSVGKTFGLRSSVSGSTGLASKESQVGSLTRRDQRIAEDSTRGLKEIGKQESNMSVYSTVSYLPAATVVPPPIRISHCSPPKPTYTPTSPARTIINYSHPRSAPSSPTPPHLHLTLDRIPSPPLMDDLPHFPSAPTSRHTIYRPPTPPTSPPKPEGYSTPADYSWDPQPLLSKLSTLPENSASVVGKEERVKKVLRWRRDIGDDHGDIGGTEVGFQGLTLGKTSISRDKGRGRADDKENVPIARQEEEGGDDMGKLDGMIAQHVQGEKERLREFVRRKSVSGRNMGL